MEIAKGEGGVLFDVLSKSYNLDKLFKRGDA